MTGKIIFTPSPLQRCETALGCADRPPADTLKPATVWKCDECGREWVVTEGAQYNEPYQAWRRLTESNRGGQDR
jgi:hypothetical protein